ncbi:MAG: 3-oxoacyl-[acyl-carrier-protein] reductase [Elusimicrobia bacterium]|nr:3-oxoacyl-[acyl-carrier-protein] reductase [Elusimicrobiota bacterium]
MRLKDKIAIVTGSAQGIGRAIAELFAHEGAKVVMVDMDEALVQRSAGEISQNGASSVAGVRANVTSADDCENVVKSALEKYGKIDILINNAGITKDNLVMRMSEQEWDAVINVNLKGTFLFSKAVCRPMMRAHSGRIINIASVVGQEGNMGQANYAASKGGVIALTKSLAKEFSSRNILVNAICPGFINTRLTAVVSDEAKKRMTDRILLGRMGEPIDIARGALFLASEDASYITGQVLNVNGGMYL